MFRRALTPFSAVLTLSSLGLVAAAAGPALDRPSVDSQSTAAVAYSRSSISAAFADATVMATDTASIRGGVSPGAGRTVTLQRYYSNVWHTLTRTTTTASGAYSFTLPPQPRGRYVYRTTVYSNPRSSTAISPNRTLWITGPTKVSAGLKVTTVRASATAGTLNGSVYNTAPLSRPVTLQRLSGSAWVDVATSTSSGSGGYTFALPKSGSTTSYRVQAPPVYLATPAASTSQTLPVAGSPTTPPPTTPTPPPTTPAPPPTTPTPPPTTPTPPPATDSAVLPYWGSPSWRDEFNGSAVNLDQWKVHDKTYISYDKASVYAKQCTVANGVLDMRANRVDPKTDLFGRSYASCYLTSQGKFAQRYGRFEVRAKLPTTPNVSAGLWPSFWLRDGKGSGEIDVMESWGTHSIRPAEEKPENYSWTVHADTNSGVSGVRTRKGGDGRPKGSAPITTAYHRYAAEWTPEAITFFFDDERDGQVTAKDNPWIVSSFPTSVNIRLHFAVGGAYWGEPNANTVFPADYLVDYVRVWNRP